MRVLLSWTLEERGLPAEVLTSARGPAIVVTFANARTRVMGGLGGRTK